MSDAVVVTLHLVKKLLRFLQQQLHQDKKILDGVNGIKDNLECLQAHLQEAEALEGDNKLKKYLIKKIRYAGHDSEDVLDEYMILARDFSRKRFFQWGYKFCHNVKHRASANKLQLEIAEIDKNITKLRSSPEFLKLVDILMNSHYHAAAAQGFQDDEIMGIDSAENELIKLLTEGSRPNRIFVTGRSGAGKTALVRTVYKSSKVTEQFNCQAWLSLSYTENPEQHLQNLLSQFRRGISEWHFPLVGDTASKIKKYLDSSKRYLIVLDGVSTYEQWESIKDTLPDWNNGSRIIITTQREDLGANRVDHFLPINRLIWTDSCRLFCKKAYGNENCPQHLLDSSKMIVKRCDGLPLEISAVGTLLSRKERKEDEWRRVLANSVKTLFLPCYYGLTSNQKSCLLYFSLLPEGYSIKLGMLIRLWLSEGFVEYSENEQADTIAEHILTELISRKLVEASSRDVGGRVKSCRVLNQVRLFVCQRSTETRFAAAVTDQWDGAIHRRLSIENASSNWKRVSGLNLDGVRSLFMFGMGRMSSEMIAATLKRIRLLKVLNLENAPLDSFPECILDAVLLRYLSLRNTNINKIPKKIKKLRYLEYLDLKQTLVTSLPKQIFKLRYLQQLLIYRCNYETFYRQQGVQIAGEMRAWPYIQKLSLIDSDHNPRLFAMLGKFTQLKKLGLTNLREKDGRLLCSCIEKMSQLSTLDLMSSSREEILDLHHMDVCPKSLQHLYLKGKLTSLPKWIISHNGLVRLLLRWSKLDAIPIESLQDLPKLMELEMTDAFTAPVLSIGSKGFPKLRTLHIEQLGNLYKIELCNGGMPMLRKLTIVNCMWLHNLPSGIEELKDLEELLLYEMPTELTDNLRNSHTKKIRRLIMLEDCQGKMRKGLAAHPL